MIVSSQDYYVRSRKKICKGELLELGIEPPEKLSMYWLDERRARVVINKGDYFILEEREYASRYRAEMNGWRAEIVQELESETPEFRETRTGERSWKISVSRRTPAGRLFNLSVSELGKGLAVSVSLGQARKQRLYFVLRNRLEWVPLRYCRNCQMPMVDKDTARELEEFAILVPGKDVCLCCLL